MSRVQGGGLVMIGGILLFTGVLLRWDLVDWIIDTVGFLLIIVGAVIGIVGLIKMVSGGGQSSSYDDL